MTVYVVTSGEYEQFGVDAVFSTREKAEAYIVEQRNKFGSAFSPYSIEEHVIDSPEEQGAT